MNITIKDDFDLKKISESGEAFRIKEFPEETFRFVTGNNILYIKKIGDDEYDVAPYVYDFKQSSEFHAVSRNLRDFTAKNADSHEPAKSNVPLNLKSVISAGSAWETVWSRYFDLKRNYREIRESVPAHDAFMSKAAACASGIRILKQDPFETLISFIISQRKSIPAIKNSIELICRAFGTPVTTPYETLYLFPSADDFQNSDLYHSARFTEILNSCKLGYRTEYVADGVTKVVKNKLNLNKISALSDEDLFTTLKSVKGVGNKVAACVLLFAYGRTAFAPVDTWISKIIAQKYNGQNPFPEYKENAGIMQQYAFYYALKNKGEF